MSSDSNTLRRYCTREGKGCGDKYCGRGTADGCVYEYDETRYAPGDRYTGTVWPPPKRWLSASGAIVYRSYADYCD